MGCLALLVVSSTAWALVSASPAFAADRLAVAIDPGALLGGAAAALLVGVVSQGLSARRQPDPALARIEALLAENRELSRARDQAEAVGRQRLMAFATLSHELRTPLTGVIGTAELLADSGLDADQAELLQVLHDASGRLRRLLDDSLLYSRAEAPNLQLERVAVSFPALVDRLVAAASAVARARGLRVTVTVDPQVPRASWIDPHRTAQVVDNLLHNALKYASAQVHLHVDLAGGYLRLTIRDDGPGIPAQVQPRVFEPFAQADASIARRHGGTGLGLAIAAGLSRKMGGRIEVQSEPGRGATFRLSLPSEPAELARLEPAPPAAPVVNPPTLRRVLLVEDDRTNQAVLTRQLAALGFSVEVADRGDDAWTAWRLRHHELVLTDLDIPGLGGAELTRALLQEHPGPRVVCLTGSTSPDDHRAALEAGAAACLVKPASGADLAAALGVARPRREQPTAVDLRVIEQLVGPEPAILRDILGAFLTSAGQLEDDLRSATAQGDPTAVRVLAHRFKGAALSVGARRLGTLCERAEAASARGEPLAGSPLLASLSIALAEARAAAAAHLAGLGDAEAVH